MAQFPSNDDETRMLQAMVAGKPLCCEFTRESLEDLQYTRCGDLVSADMLRLFLGWMGDFERIPESVSVCTDVMREDDISGWIRKCFAVDGVEVGVGVLYRPEHYYVVVVNRVTRLIEFKDYDSHPDDKKRIAEMIATSVDPTAVVADVVVTRSGGRVSTRSGGRVGTRSGGLVGGHNTRSTGRSLVAPADVAMRGGGGSSVASSSSKRKRKRNGDSKGKGTRQWAYVVNMRYKPSGGGVAGGTQANACSAYSAMEVLQAVGGDVGGILVQTPRFDARLWLVRRVLKHVLDDNVTIHLAEESRRWVVEWMKSDLKAWANGSDNSRERGWPDVSRNCSICLDRIADDGFHTHQRCCCIRMHVHCLASFIENADKNEEMCIHCKKLQTCFAVVRGGRYIKEWCYNVDKSAQNRDLHVNWRTMMGRELHAEYAETIGDEGNDVTNADGGEGGDVTNEGGDVTNADGGDDDDVTNEGGGEGDDDDVTNVLPGSPVCVESGVDAVAAVAGGLVDPPGSVAAEVDPPGSVAAGLEQADARMAESGDDTRRQAVVGGGAETEAETEAAEAFLLMQARARREKNSRCRTASVAENQARLDREAGRHVRASACEARDMARRKGSEATQKGVASRRAAMEAQDKRDAETERLRLVEAAGVRDRRLEEDARRRGGGAVGRPPRDVGMGGPPLNIEVCNNAAHSPVTNATEGASQPSAEGAPGGRGSPGYSQQGEPMQQQDAFALHQPSQEVGSDSLEVPRPDTPPRRDGLEDADPRVDGLRNTPMGVGWRVPVGNCPLGGDLRYLKSAHVGGSVKDRETKFVWFGAQVFAFNPHAVRDEEGMPGTEFGETEMTEVLSAWFVPVIPVNPWTCGRCSRVFYNVSQKDHHDEVISAYGCCPMLHFNSRDLVLRDRSSAFFLPSKLVASMCLFQPEAPLDILDATRRPLCVQGQTKNTEFAECATGCGELVRVAANTFKARLSLFEREGKGATLGFQNFIGWQGDQFWRSTKLWKEGGPEPSDGLYHMSECGPERFSLYPECLLLPFIAPIGRLPREYQTAFYKSRAVEVAKRGTTLNLEQVRGFPSDPDGV